MKAWNPAKPWAWMLALPAALLLGGTLGHAAAGCDDLDKACLQSAFDRHPVRALASWKAALARPLVDRIGNATADLIDYVRLDNLINAYPERPRATEVNPELLRDTKAALAEIAPDIQALFKGRLAGIFFLENLGSTGYTEYIRNRAGQRVAAFVILDAGVLKPFNANAWASWKENTPFKPGSGYVLKALIEDPSHDNRKNAIQYILLHELGHVLSVGRNIHPPWDLPQRPAPKGTYPFLDLSWTAVPGTDALTSRFDDAFPQRKDVVYYWGAKLDGAQMVATYSNLEATNFPTLYAATRPGDDFAEAFASYVHVVRLGRPWRITIERDGQAAKVIESCWNQARCAHKRRLLESLLAAAGKSR